MLALFSDNLVDNMGIPLTTTTIAFAIALGTSAGDLFSEGMTFFALYIRDNKKVLVAKRRKLVYTIFIIHLCSIK